MRKEWRPDGDNHSPDYVPSSSCSEIILSQLEHSVRHRRGSHGDECEAGKHLPEREAAAEAVGELGQVAPQMLGAEVVVRAMKGALDVAQYRVVLIGAQVGRRSAR